ncbi:MAG: LacI family DNA-binding transcriptional regulator [Balneolales bacterium]
MATLQEVAKKAGVSITTVSRVLNNSSKVNEDTRTRVQGAVNKLGYQPSRVAQRMRYQQGHSKLLGLIIPDIQNPYYSSIVRGVEDVAYKRNYALILCNSDEEAAKEKFYLEVLRSESVDGVIFPPIHEHGRMIGELVKNGLPVVCVDRRLANLTVDTVVVNNHKGAYNATSELINLGHRRIGFISSMPHFSSFKERRQGYEDALTSHGIPVNEDYIRLGDQRKPESGRVFAHELLGLDKKPTAFFVSNNLMTLGAIEAIHQKDLKIPDDVSIIGFDDMPWAKSINPPLSVVRQPGYEMGRRAAEMFFQRIEEPDREPVLVMLEPTLVLRDSCRAISPDGQKYAEIKNL